MFRNLNVLRDIHRIITEARARKQRVITFKDEEGSVWKLQRVEQRQTQRSQTISVPLTR